jgi:phospholipid/cholesterol/gamma-HCH transport system permease protein
LDVESSIMTDDIGSERHRGRPDFLSASSLQKSIRGTALDTVFRGVGEFFAMALDTMVLMFRPPFAFRELILQVWFVARVSIVPTIALSIPFTVLVVFTFNILLIDIGAADSSGTTAAFGTVAQVGPLVTVLVVAGAGATAMCADLGARTIREELDALSVLGINPIQALVVPRVLAATLVAFLLAPFVTIVGLTGGFLFAVFVQNVSPGAYASGLTVLVGVPEVTICMVKATLFGFAAGLIACFKGISVRGGAAAVGAAVNETVIYAFVGLFLIDVLVTAVGVGTTK